MTTADGLDIFIEEFNERGTAATLTDSVVAMIEANNAKGLIEGEARHLFYGKILKALATHYVVDWPDAQSVTYLEVLETMVRECGERPETGLNAGFRFEVV